MKLYTIISKIFEFYFITGEGNKKKGRKGVGKNKQLNETLYNNIKNI